ncbi:MAG: hypothetical protein ACXAC5_04805 [Promethearchaeota archaeon]|jgi:hypothetical protein
MKQLVIGLLLITASCKGEAECSSDWFKAAGLEICDNDLGVSSDEVEYAVDVLENNTSSRSRYSDVTGLKKTFKDNQIEVIFTDQGIATGCEQVDGWGDIYYCDRFTIGVNLDGVRIYVKYNDCLSRTAFIHELLHSIEYFYLNVEDKNAHNTPEFFVKVGQESGNTIESSVNRILENTLERCNTE